MSRFIVILLLALSSCCHALCTRGPEGPKGEQQTPPRTYKWINSSCVQFDNTNTILCSNPQFVHEIFNDVAYFMTGGAITVLFMVLVGAIVWWFWKEPEFFCMWLKFMFTNVFVLGPIAIRYKEMDVWGSIMYWCVFASVWYCLDVVLASGKRVWRDTIVPAWKDPASIANLKLE